MSSQTQKTGRPSNYQRGSPSPRQTFPNPFPWGRGRRRESDCRPWELWKKSPRSIESARTIDASGCLVMPGLMNGHNHAAMTCYRGMADDLPLMEWLTRYIFPAETGSDGDQVYWSTLLACAEMIRSGTTTFFDMYLFEGRVADAAKEAGMRALVGEVLYDFPSPNYGPIEKGLEYTEALIKRWQGDPLIRVAVEPHALYTCSPQLLGAMPRSCGKTWSACGNPPFGEPERG